MQRTQLMRLLIRGLLPMPTVTAWAAVALLVQHLRLLMRLLMRLLIRPAVPVL